MEENESKIITFTAKRRSGASSRPEKKTDAVLEFFRSHQRETNEILKVVEYDGFWYRPIVDKIRDKHGSTTVISDVEQILDGYLRPAFTLIREDVEEGQTELQSYILGFHGFRGDEKRVLIPVTASDLATERDFTTALLKHALLSFSGGKPELNYIRVNMLKLKEQDRVRWIDRFGHDEQTGAFVFQHFAISSVGEVIFPNDYGYFNEINIKPPFVEKAVKKPALTADMHLFTSTFNKAFGARGLAVFGYYLATILSPDIFAHPKFGGFHPFLSITGKPGTGKSTLLLILHYIFTFQAGRDGQAVGQSTAKGLLRMMAQSSSLPVVLSENNKEAEAEGSKRYGKLDENTLLPLYNRQSAQIRANKTNDLTTNSVPFSAGIVMAQNHDPHTLRAIKERTIAIDYDSVDFSDDQKEAFLKLKQMELPDEDGCISLCGVGIEIYRNRGAISKLAISNLDEAYKLLAESGVTNERIAKNFALIIGSLLTFAEYFKVDPSAFFEAGDYLVTLAKSRYDNCISENDTSIRFFDAFQSLVAGGFLEPGVHFVANGNTVYMRLTEVENIMARHGYDVARSPILRSSLRLCSHFKNENHATKGWTKGPKVQKAWVFTIIDLPAHLAT